MKLLGFPKQKFICLDGYLIGNSNVYSALYNQLGARLCHRISLRACLSTFWHERHKPRKENRMIIGQNYPAMEKMIIPGILKGLKAY